MSSDPANPAWSASKAIDGDATQNYTFNSSAISDISHRKTSVWWKVWLQRPFNGAYLEIYFRSDSKSYELVYNREKRRERDFKHVQRQLKHICIRYTYAQMIIILSSYKQQHIWNSNVVKLSMYTKRKGF